jgi:DNA processing protein
MAAEQGREVFAVPLAARSRGRCQRFDQAGRDAGYEAADVVNAVQPIWRGRSCTARAESDRSTPNPMRANATHRRPARTEPDPARRSDRMANTSPAIVRTVLLELELAGRPERHGGGLVSLI